jgi:hypothetical protein
MGRKPLFVSLVFGCIGAILLPILAYSHHRPTPDQVSSDAETYDVYSAAIKELFLKGRYETRTLDGLRVRLVVIGDRTVPYRWQEWNDPSKRALDWAEGRVGVDDSAVEDFKRKCTESVSLKPLFTLPAKQVLISDQELGDFFDILSSGSWARFYKRYPNSVGFVSLSRVGFNLNHDQAFLYVALRCGDLCGSGYYVLLAKDEGAWSVKHIDPLWVS